TSALLRDVFLVTAPASPGIYALSLHDALPISFRLGLIAAVLLVLALLAGSYLYLRSDWFWRIGESAPQPIPFRHDLHVAGIGIRSEEHTSELQSRENLVCRLLLEKKNAFILES